MGYSWSDFKDDVGGFGQNILDAGSELLELDWDGFVDELQDAGQNLQDFITGLLGIEDPINSVFVNVSSISEPIKIIYGTRRVGVNIIHAYESSDSLYVVAVICEGEGSNITDLYIDDDISTDSKFATAVTVENHLGTIPETSSTLMTDPEWTVAHRLDGTMYFVIKLDWEKDLWRGLPNFEVVVEGLKIYDLITSTTIYSNNPINVLYNYLTNTRYGLGVSGTEIHLQSFLDEAAYCNDSVTSYSGGPAHTRYTCDIILNPATRIFDNIKLILATCRGSLVFENGQFKVSLEKATASTFTFDESNMLGKWNISSADLKNRFNRVKCTFPDPQYDYRENYVIAESSAFRTEDNGRLLETTIQLSGVTDIYRAFDIASFVLRRSRNLLRAAFTSTIEASECSIGDVVDITHPSPGWTSKEARIVSLTQVREGEVRVVVEEYFATIYDQSLPNEYPIPPTSSLPDYTSMSVATSVNATAGTADLYESQDGTILPGITVTWTKAPTYLQSQSVLYKKTTDSEFITAVTLYDSNAESYKITGVDVGSSYNIRVLSTNAAGYSSSADMPGSVNVQGKTENPTSPTGMAVNNETGSVRLTWNSIPDLDYHITEVHASASNNRASAILVGTSSEGTFVHATVDNLYYWIIHKDSTLHYSNNWFPVSATAGILGGPNAPDYSNLTNAPTSISDINANEGSTLVNVTDNLIPSTSNIGGFGNVFFTSNVIAGGSANDGEIRIQGNTYYHPDGTKRALGTSDTTLYTPYEAAITATTFFIMYTNTAPHARFGGVSTDWGDSTTELRFCIVIYNAINNTWQAVNNANTGYAFTPIATDALVARGSKTSGTGGIDSLQSFVGVNQNLPDDGATVGATWGANIVSQPADESLLNVYSSIRDYTKYTGIDINAASGIAEIVPFKINNDTATADRWYRIAQIQLTSIYSTCNLVGWLAFGASSRFENIKTQVNMTFTNTTPAEAFITPQLDFNGDDLSSIIKVYIDTSTSPDTANIYVNLQSFDGLIGELSILRTYASASLKFWQLGEYLGEVYAAPGTLQTFTLNRGVEDAATIGAVIGSNLTGSFTEAEANTRFNAGSINGNKIVANTVTALEIAANTITASQIAANTITASQILSGTITANEITVSTLSSLSANIGAITAGTIDGITVTGGTVRTSSATTRVELDGTANELQVYVGGAVVASVGKKTLTDGDALISAQNGTANSIAGYFSSSSDTKPALWAINESQPLFTTMLVSTDSYLAHAMEIECRDRALHIYPNGGLAAGNGLESTVIIDTDITTNSAAIEIAMGANGIGRGIDIKYNGGYGLAVYPTDGIGFEGAGIWIAGRGGSSAPTHNYLDDALTLIYPGAITMNEDGRMYLRQKESNGSLISTSNEWNEVFTKRSEIGPDSFPAITVGAYQYGDEFGGSNSSNTGMIKLGEVMITKSGTYRCGLIFTFNEGKNNGTAYARIYKSGSTHGTLRTATVSGSIYVEQDLVFSAGEKAQVYGYETSNDGSMSASVTLQVAQSSLLLPGKLV